MVYGGGGVEGDDDGVRDSRVGDSVERE